MPERSRPAITHEASASVLGYLYQVHVALLELLRRNRQSPGIALTIEKLDDMRAWATRLELEYATTSVRIDPGRLTVVADTNTGTVPLARMGSASNWVGYHLVAYLALQKFFVQNNRPVPGFVVFDQPTQAFYPPDIPEQDVAALPDADRQAVDELFSLLHDVSSTLAPDLQIIVTDHAKLTHDWFAAAIAEEWRGGLKLVPEDW